MHTAFISHLRPELLCGRPIQSVWTLICLALTICAARAASIPEVGPHEPILVVEKNVNPQNILVVYTKVDGAGHFLRDASDASRPFLDFIG